MTHYANAVTLPLAEYQPRHFLLAVDGPVATVTLNRPEKKNPLTFDSYAELRDTFRQLAFATDVKVVIVTGAGGNFCSGGDVHEIIGPLVRMREAGRMDELLAFMRMTGDLVKAMRACPQPIIAAVDGVCAGAGAIIAMASDLRIGSARSRVAFLFVRVGLSGADMGAAHLLPRLVGLARATELLYTGDFITAAEAERIGLYNRVVPAAELRSETRALAERLARGPSFALAMTKEMLNRELDVSLDTALEWEAQAQAVCMQHPDYAEGYRAFSERREPRFNRGAAEEG